MIYFIEDKVTHSIKIGTAKNPQKRLAALRTANPCELVLLGAIPGRKREEQQLQVMFGQYIVRGEWFSGEILGGVLDHIFNYKRYSKRIVGGRNAWAREIEPPNNVNLKLTNQIPKSTAWPPLWSFTEIPNGANRERHGILFRHTLKLEREARGRAFSMRDLRNGFEYRFRDEDNAAIAFADVRYCVTESGSDALSASFRITVYCEGNSALSQSVNEVLITPKIGQQLWANPSQSVYGSKLASKGIAGIYFVQHPITRHIKIGFATDVKKRVDGLQTANAVELVLLGVIEGSLQDEKRLHKEFRQHKHRGEWFSGEIFGPVVELIFADMKRTRQVIGGGTMNTAENENPAEQTLKMTSRIPGLKVASFDWQLTETVSKHEALCGFMLKYVLEFEKDFSVEELVELQKAIPGNSLGPFAQHGTVHGGIGHLILDEDNADIPFRDPQKSTIPYRVVGSVTGHVGSAFRVLIDCERSLRKNHGHGRIHDVFIGDNYPGEHPMKKVKEIVVYLIPIKEN